MPTGTEKSTWRSLQPAVGVTIAAACLVWVFHDIRLEELWHSLPALNWRWVALALVLDVLTYVCQGWRWRLLLRPRGEVSLLRATQAVYAGLFTNELVPMRFGELVRAYLVSRWLPAELAAVLPSIIVERLLDGVWLAVGIGLAGVFVPMPKRLLRGVDTLGFVVLVGTVLFVYIVLREEESLAEARPGKIHRWRVIQVAHGFVRKLAEGLRQIGLSRRFYLAGAISLLMVALQALAFWLLMRAYGLRMSVGVGTVVWMIVHLGIAVPNAPANVGTYQFFTVVGLTLFGVEKTVATGFSVVVFILLTIPLWVLGFLALTRSGTTLFAIRQEIDKLMVRQS